MDGPAKVEPGSYHMLTLRQCQQQLLKPLHKMPGSPFFAVPVDATLLPDYPTIVKNPMDLGTVGKKLEGAPG